MRIMTYFKYQVSQHNGYFPYLENDILIISFSPICESFQQTLEKPEGAITNK